MNLSEFRKRYPMYNDMSDQLLADRLYQRYYSDMPRNVFNQKIGYTPPEPTLKDDIWNSISNAPRNLLQGLASLPSEALASGAQIVSRPLRAAENVVAGAGESLKGLVNLPANVAQYFNKKNIQFGDPSAALRVANMFGGAPAEVIAKYLGTPQGQQTLSQMRLPEDMGIEKALGLNTPVSGDNLLRGIGGFIPFEGIGKGAAGLSGLLQRAGGSALYGAAQNQNPLTAALVGSGAEKIGSGLSNLKGRVSRALTPSSPLSPEELAHNLDVVRGTNTSLGQVLDNPTWQRVYENVLKKVPLSQVNETMQRTANQIKGKGENILAGFGQNLSQNEMGSALKNALKNVYNDTMEEKQRRYNAVNEQAQKENISIGRDNLSQVANDYLKGINSNPELQRTVPNAILDDLAAYKNSTEKRSLKDSDLLRGILSQKARDLYQGKGLLGTNKYASNIYNDLTGALNNDIESAITANGSDTLKKMRQDAHDFYKNEVVPFEDKDIAKFTRGKGDTDLLLNTFLKASPLNDRVNQLAKLMDKLPEDKQGIVPYAYFSKSIKDNTFNPTKFKTLYNKLGEGQKNTLFANPETQQAVKNYVDLVSKNSEPLNMMFNPNTGQRNADMLSYIINAVGGGGGMHIGKALAGLPGAIAGSVISPMIVGKAVSPLTKWLTNEAVREKVVNKLIAQKRNNTPAANIPSSNIRQKLINSRRMVVPLSLNNND